jgi:hypothetical protein
MEGKLLKRKYAHAQNTEINTVLFPKNGRRYYGSERAAQGFIAELRRKYIVAKLPEGEEPNPNEVELWIKGYFIANKPERREKFRGDYVKFFVCRLGQTKHYYIEYSPVEKDGHPEMPEERKTYPNLRNSKVRDIIENKKEWDTYEKARSEFESLMHSFPNAYKWGGDNKLNMKLYNFDKNEGAGGGKTSPIKNYIFEIKELANGRFLIDYELSENQEWLYKRHKFTAYSLGIASRQNNIAEAGGKE